MRAFDDDSFEVFLCHRSVALGSFLPPEQRRVMEHGRIGQSDVDRFRRLISHRSEALAASDDTLQAFNG